MHITTASHKYTARHITNSTPCPHSCARRATCARACTCSPFGSSSPSISHGTLAGIQLLHRTMRMGCSADACCSVADAYPVGAAPGGCSTSLTLAACALPLPVEPSPHRRRTAAAPPHRRRAAAASAVENDGSPGHAAGAGTLCLLTAHKQASTTHRQPLGCRQVVKVFCVKDERERNHHGLVFATEKFSHWRGCVCHSLASS
jgi:hypothetical protein